MLDWVEDKKYNGNTQLHCHVNNILYQIRPEVKHDEVVWVVFKETFPINYHFSKLDTAKKYVQNLLLEKLE